MATVTEALQLAAQHSRANRLPQAEQIYRKVLTKQPNNPDALHGLGMVAYQAGQYQASETLLSTVLQVQPNSVKTWFSLGNLRQTQGQLAEAIAAYQKVLTLQPNLVPAYNNLGYTFQLQENWQQAIACYRKALELQPTCTEADVNLANVLHSQGQLAPEQAAHYGAINHDLGLVRQKAGDLPTALTYYRQAIALNPGLAIAQYHLGMVLQAQGQTEAAMDAYQRAIKLDPLKDTVQQHIIIQKLARLQQSQKRRDSGRLRSKVAFVCQPFVRTSFPNPGDSIGILTYELIRRLAADCDVIVYLAGDTRQAKTHEGIQYRSIPVKFDHALQHWLGKVPGLYHRNRPDFATSEYYIGYALQVAKDLSRENADIVHIHNLSQFVPVIRAINPHIKIVLHMHCEWLRQLNRWAIGRRLRQVDLVLSPSQYITDGVRNRFPAIADRCQTIYNGVSVDHFLTRSAQPAQPRPSTGPKRLLYVGRVSPEKGTHVLLEAFKQVRDRYPEVHLDIVGPIQALPYEYLVALSDDPKVADLKTFYQEESWLSYLKRTLAQFTDQDTSATSDKHNESTLVSDQPLHLPPTPLASPAPPDSPTPPLPSPCPDSFIGAVPPSQLPQYYQRADIFVFPSVCHEAFGMPIAEAMVAGLPVVASHGGAFPELVEDGETGFIVELGDADALAQAILRLLEDETLGAKLGTTGQERAVTRFAFDTVALDLLRQYDRLLGIGGGDA
ncbi:MAG: glycosyltransferase [Leptolyngbyaceae cyanobacterium]